MNLGSNLYNARKKSGLSQEEVAEKLRAAGLEILETHSAEGWFSYLCR